MLKMIFPRLIVDEVVVKEDEVKGVNIRLRYCIHEAFEGGGCIVEKKVITKNSYWPS